MKSPSFITRRAPRSLQPAHTPFTTFSSRIKKYIKNCCPSILVASAIFSTSLLVASSHLPAVAAPQTSQKSAAGVVTAANTDVRTSPSDSALSLSKLSPGAKATAWGKYNGWYRVITSDHQYGWIRHDQLKVNGHVDELSSSDVKTIFSKDLQKRLSASSNYDVGTIKPTTQAPSRGGSPRDAAKWAQSNGNSSFGQSVANSALSYRGRPYVFGGTTPRGFDCSGLVQHVLRQKGLSAPRTTTGQVRYGTPVARKDLQVGDMVFFSGTYRSGVSHVGIYIGNNNFVHAANPRRGVRVDSLSNKYYASHYHSARRPPQK